MLRRLMIDRTTISAIAGELGVSWHTVSTTAMHAVAELITSAGPDRLTGVRVIGVDEHRWAPRRRGTHGLVTLIIDLTPVHDRTGPARLLDLVPGRSAAALSTWLADQPPAFRAQVEVIAMDGLGGYETAAAKELPEATAVVDPFHVVALAGAKLDLIRQRIQQLTCGHRGRNESSGHKTICARYQYGTAICHRGTNSVDVVKVCPSIAHGTAPKGSVSKLLDVRTRPAGSATGSANPTLATMTARKRNPNAGGQRRSGHFDHTPAKVQLCPGRRLGGL